MRSDKLTASLGRNATRSACAAPDADHEEKLSADPNRGWEKLDAGSESWKAPYDVDRRDPSNVVAKVKVHLVGEDDAVKSVQSTEDAIEKHLAIPGFTVDVEFVDRGGEDVHTVNVAVGAWEDATTWSPNNLAPTHSHELLHRLGLPDEYDVKQHSHNLSRPWLERLSFTVQSWFQALPADAEEGIMAHPDKKPLRRHIDQVVGVATRAPDCD